MAGDTPGWLPAVVIPVWLVLNIGLNSYNKWVFSSPEAQGYGASFEFPMFYSAANMVATVIGALLLTALKLPGTEPISLTKFTTYWWQLCLLSIFFAISLVTNNASLESIGLSVNQIVKACTPLPTMLLSCFIEQKRYSIPVMASVAALVASACGAIPYGDPTATPIGLVLVIISAVAIAAKISLSALLMSKTAGPGFAPVTLVFYDSTLSFLFLALMWLGDPEERDASLAFIKR